jgi:hypothetical protein
VRQELSRRQVTMTRESAARLLMLQNPALIQSLTEKRVQMMAR